MAQWPIQESPASLFSEIHRALERRDEKQLNAYLDLARYSESSAFEFHLIQGLVHLRHLKYDFAYLSFCTAIEIYDENDEVLALCARSISYYSAPIALRFLEQVLAKFPGSARLWIEYWRTDHDERPEIKIQKIMRRMPLVINAEEKACLLAEIKKNPPHPRYIGVVEKDDNSKYFMIWAHDFADEGGNQLKLICRTRHGAEELSPENVENLRFKDQSFRIMHYKKKINASSMPFDIFFPDGSIPLNSNFREKNKYPARRVTSKHSETVDIIIPVYGGLPQTMRCLKSVGSANRHNQRRHQVIVIDDASPDTGISNSIRHICKNNGFTYLKNPHNLGFIGSINKGFDLHKSRDIIILNSDTIVHGDWIDRLTAVSHKFKNIASVTPLSNYGELMSFPIIKTYNELPDPPTARMLDQLLRQINMEPLAIPSGCGFCMLINRTALETIGYLDEENLLRGYGEETDWCLRAKARGYTHLGAMNIYIRHEGGSSFGVEKLGLALRNNQVIEHKFPNAKMQHTAFLLSAVAKNAFNRLKWDLLTTILEIAEKNQTKIIIKLPDELIREQEDNCLTISLDIKNGEAIADCAIKKIKGISKFNLQNVSGAERLLQGLKNQFSNKIYITHKVQHTIFKRKYDKSRYQLIELSKATERSISISTQIIPSNLYLIADFIDDLYLGKRWKIFLLSANARYPKFKFLLTNMTSWRRELIRLNNVIFSPAPKHITMSDHLNISGCRLALSLEDRQNVLKNNYWQAANFAEMSNIPFISGPSILNKLPIWDSMLAVEEICSLMRDLHDGK